MTGADKVIDDMGRGCVAAGAAEPFVAGKAFHNTARVMNAAVPDGDLLLEPEMVLNYCIVQEYSRACMSRELFLFLRAEISLARLVSVGGASDSAL